MGVPTQTYLQTVRSFCDVPAAGGPTARPDDVSAIAQQTQAHGDQLFLLVNDPAVLKPCCCPSRRRPIRWGSSAALPTALGRRPDRPALVMGNGMERPLLVRVLPGGFLQPVSRDEVIQ